MSDFVLKHGIVVTGEAVGQHEHPVHATFKRDWVHNVYPRILNQDVTLAFMKEEKALRLAHHIHQIHRNYIQSNNVNLEIHHLRESLNRLSTKRENLAKALEHSRTINKMDRKSCAATIKMFFKNEKEKNPALFIYFEESLLIAYKITTPLSANNQLDAITIQKTIDKILADFQFHKTFSLSYFPFSDIHIQHNAFDSTLCFFEWATQNWGPPAAPPQNFHYDEYDHCFQNLIQYLGQNFIYYDYHGASSSASSSTLLPINQINSTKKRKTKTTTTSYDSDSDSDSCATTTVTDQTNLISNDLQRRVNQVLQKHELETEDDDADSIPSIDTITTSLPDEQKNKGPGSKPLFISKEYQLTNPLPGTSKSGKPDVVNKKGYNYLNPKTIDRERKPKRIAKLNSTNQAIVLSNHPNPTARDICP
ncbi:3791_t:CDS:2, partial [Racocetra fulgida]